ncbi:hypothetical protein GCM10011579_080300 [Streptomyces albiflavescens]|uniref:AraC family transcriptional regulator n=1 Tax=Streptomyces albiflavescens TaxID=1623582 RepID=A0A917YBY4_9ACTN|nr:hypothetical protein GCM10011579_080300 [Streptomyces albiflavescens]
MRPAPVERAPDALHQRPEHPFNGAGLAAEAGIGVRRLQDAFRRYRDLFRAALCVRPLPLTPPDA